MASFNVFKQNELSHTHQLNRSNFNKRVIGWFEILIECLVTEARFGLTLHAKRLPHEIPNLFSRKMKDNFPDKSAYLKIIFLISQPTHILWVLRGQKYFNIALVLQYN